MLLHEYQSNDVENYLVIVLICSIKFNDLHGFNQLFLPIKGDFLHMYVCVYVTFATKLKYLTSPEKVTHEVKKNTCRETLDPTLPTKVRVS